MAEAGVGWEIVSGLRKKRRRAERTGKNEIAVNTKPTGRAKKVPDP